MEIPRHWRLKQQRYNLVGEVCPGCQTPMFPARDFCLGCNKEVPKDLRPISKIIFQASSSDQTSMSSK
jgi:uncharacterized OB-fold protein